jgi:TRAP-type C4-dicarboxylate transport system permease small subunit
METAKKTFAIILDIVEKYIPALTFGIMFSLFILQIFFRYFLNSPLTWPYELTLFAFIWTVMLGGGYAMRLDDHVEFGVVYDKLSSRGKCWFRLIGNGLVTVAFLISIVPVYKSVMAFDYRKSAVLRIPYHIAFFPFVVLFLIIIGRNLYRLSQDFKQLRRS